ncbi:hypothetical protein D3C81_1140990 [compost metagenome]
MVAGLTMALRKACTTSCTNTGWKRACAHASGTTGAICCICANRLRKWSSGPNTTDGRRMVQSSPLARTMRSPSPLLRRYIDGPWLSAPSALICNSRRTPVDRHEATIWRTISTWALAKASP